MALPTRTWPYGTRLNAQVITVRKKADPYCPLVTMLKDEKGEGNVIMGVTHDVQFEDSQNVVMEFTKGGHTGGYWKIIEVKKP